MEVKETDFIGIRVPIKLRELVKEYIRLDTHLNESEFVRSAIREKLQRDAPMLRDRLFEVELSGNTNSKMEALKNE